MKMHAPRNKEYMADIQNGGQTKQLGILGQQSLETSLEITSNWSNHKLFTFIKEHYKMTVQDSNTHTQSILEITESLISSSAINDNQSTLTHY